METNPNDWLNAADRIFARAMGYGLTVAAITGVIWGLFWSEVFEKTMMGGYAHDAVRLICVAALALLMLGFVSWLVRFLFDVAAAPFRWIKKVREEEREDRVILQNVSMMTKETRALLFYFMNQDDGRFQSPGDNKMMEQLMTLQVVSPESYGLLGGTYEGQLMRVHPSLMRKKAKERVGQWVETDFPGFNTNPIPTLTVIRTMMFRRV